jgi:ribose/xylose/arabinose/galactoside ABC-type transport system permease subunit
MGSVIGAYTIQALTTTLYAMKVSSDQLPVYKALVVIVIVVIQSPVFRKAVSSMKHKKAVKANAD